jgi:hypothetical protein
MKLQPTQSQAEIFRKIFVYHNIDENEIALQLWTDDLFKYSADIITAAWNEWRMNEKIKPKSFDIAKIAKRLKYIEESKKIDNQIKPRRDSDFLMGRSVIEDEMLRQQELALKKNPYLLEQIRETNSVYEKITLCALAQNIDMNKINGILAPLFKRWKENEQKEAAELKKEQVKHEEPANNQFKGNSNAVKSILNEKMSELSWLLQD